MASQKQDAGAHQTTSFPGNLASNRAAQHEDSATFFGTAQCRVIDRDFMTENSGGVPRGYPPMDPYENVGFIASSFAEFLEELRPMQ
jgi:hypothetical protein